MKVLIMIGSFKTGGAERMSINTGLELTRRGHDVFYLIQKPIFEIPNNIPRDRIVVLRSANEKGLLQKVKSLFIGVYFEVKKIKPDVIIAFSRFSSFLACFSFHKRIVGRFDMNPFTLSRKQRIWANVVINNPFVRRIVVPSTGMLRALTTKKRAKARKFIVIANSIDKAEVKAKANDSLEGFDFPFICAMGRIAHQKNFSLLVRAFHNSKLRRMVKLVIIGDGILRNKLESEISNLGLGDSVIITGKLKNPFPVVKKALFMVNTSDRESFCNVILEGLTLLLPVVATNCDYGPEDMVLDGINGFLTTPGDEKELVAVLDKLAENSEVLDQLRQNTESSVEKFQITNVVDSWEKLINEVTKG